MTPQKPCKCAKCRKPLQYYAGKAKMHCQACFDKLPTEQKTKANLEF